jgi:hypothetical protein
MRRISALSGAVLGLALVFGSVSDVLGTRDEPPGPQIVAAAAADDSMTAIDLRVLLGRLLGEHSFLLLDAMRARSLEAEEADAVTAALGENSAALEAAIASVYGDDPGRQFGALWDEHVLLLLDYADATRAGDEGRRQAAEDGLDDYTVELGEALAALNPALHAHDETVALRLHVEQVRAFADGDFAGAYAAHRAAFGHMFELGDHLALEIARQFPERFTGGAVAFSPRSDLRLTLDRLIAEHLVLAAQAMRAGIAGSPDFDAAARSLGLNTEDLSGAIGGIYGANAGELFEGVWTQHIDAYVGFVRALGSGDDGARASSLASLHAYHEQIAAFLAQVNPRLDQAAVADLIRRHVQALITQAEATAADDPARAIAATRDGYDGTFEVGEALAEAIAAQFPDRFVDLKALPPTDTVARRDAPWRPDHPLLLLLIALTTAMWVTASVLSGRRRAEPADRT